MRIAVLMDPIEQTYPGETTHFIGREAARRGHELLYCTPRDLAYESPRVTATVRALSYTPIDRLEPTRGVGIGCVLGEQSIIDLDDVDVVLMRQDPPFDEAYLATTYLLERHPCVVNDPRAVRDTAEKLSTVYFPDLAPPTLVTADKARLRAFRETHGDLVIKQLFGKGGERLFLVRRDDKNWNVLLEMSDRVPVMAQKYLDATSKKVVVLDGKPLRALQIEPEPDDIRGNLDRGREVRRTELTAAETRAVERVAKFVGERGIVFAVVDLLGPYVIETNVTSPGICFYYQRLYDEPLDRMIVDAIEARARR